MEVGPLDLFGVSYLGLGRGVLWCLGYLDAYLLHCVVVVGAFVDIHESVWDWVGV